MNIIVTNITITSETFVLFKEFLCLFYFGVGLTIVFLN